MKFGDKVREERTRRHLSQEALAIASGLSRKTVQNVESGKHFGAETALALKAVLSISDEQPAPEDVLLEAYVSQVPVASDRRAISRNETWTALALAGGTVALVLQTLVYLVLGWIGQEWAGAFPTYVHAPSVLMVACMGVALGLSLRSSRMRTEEDVDRERAMARERFLRDASERESFRRSIAA